MDGEEAGIKRNGMEKELAEKYKRLREKISGYVPEGIAVAFSGGVDSALLCKLACMAAGEKDTVYAVTVQTRLHPAKDPEAARQAAEEFGALHKLVRIDELAESGIETNPVNRCYLCKRSIFRKIKELAEELGAGIILEGTNADDLHQYRPGIQALKELQISSPLAECGLTKTEIRKLAEYLGIPAASRPSAPCLATRLPYGTAISYELLKRIDEGERYLRELGFYNVRLRVHELTEAVVHKTGEGENTDKSSGVQEDKDIERKKRKWLARIEVDIEDIPKLLKHREELTKMVKGLGFARVTLDMEGFRSGSMDE